MSISSLASVVFAVVAGSAASARGQVFFLDVAPETGTTDPGWGRGVAWADLDGDGLLDLVLADAGMNLGVYRQLADHTFEPAFDTWGFLDDARSHWGILAADFDDDGDVDLYVFNGGFTGAQQNQVLRNDLSSAGVFTDVSDSSGDGALSRMTFGGTTLDYDRDGLLDVFLANNGKQGCNLLHNEGGMVFKNVSNAAGIAQTGGLHRHCSAGDVDNDGWIDVGVGNFGGDNLLYRNNGDGTFTDVAASAGVTSPGANFGFQIEDFDNDGWMDVYVPKHQIIVTEPSGLFLNRHDGTFLDVSDSSGMTGQADMGHNTGDVDGDGYPDIFIGTGSPAAKMFDKLILVVPDASSGLLVTDVSRGSGILANGPTRCHGSGFADYDRDGDLDFYINNGGPEADSSQIETNALWQNQGTGRHWLELTLTGVRSNRSAVGARAVVTTGAGRAVHRFLSAGKGFGNTDSATLHFGLGDDSTIAELDVVWPNGITQRLLAPAIDSGLKMVETGLGLRGDPAVGAHVDLDACGPSDETLILFLALSDAWLPMPRLHGVLELLPPLFPIWIATLDGSGLASLPIDVPPDPALAGVSVHLQACVHSDDETTHGILTNRIELQIH